MITEGIVNCQTRVYSRFMLRRAMGCVLEMKTGYPGHYPQAQATIRIIYMSLRYVHMSGKKRLGRRWEVKLCIIPSSPSTEPAAPKSLRSCSQPMRRSSYSCTRLLLLVLTTLPGREPGCRLVEEPFLYLTGPGSVLRGYAARLVRGSCQRFGTNVFCYFSTSPCSGRPSCSSATSAPVRSSLPFVASSFLSALEPTVSRCSLGNRSYVWFWR